MRTVVVLSLNTAIDRIVSVPAFRPGGVNDARTARAFAGGKGMNVARVLRHLDVPVRVVGFLGGAASPAVRAASDGLGIDQRWVEIEGETRTCVIAVDERTGEQTVINEPGPRVTPEEVARLEEAVTGATAPGVIVCISGSAPPGFPLDYFPRLIQQVNRKRGWVLADVKGEALRQVLRHYPWALTPNEEEARAVLGVEGRLQMARALAPPAVHALLTLGEEGAIYASRSAAIRLTPPSIRAVNAVGSGDAAVAGFVAGICRGMDGPDAARLAVACGASNASRLEPDIGDAEEIEELMRGVGMTLVEDEPAL